MSSPTRRALFAAFARIGCLSFGGPAGQIALMHQEIVDRRQWVDEGAYLRALNFCHLLPGPEAQQLATWIGWRLHGVLGGLIAGLLFVLPGALVMLGLSLLYIAAADTSWFAGVFLGIKAAVLAIVAQAVQRIASRALKGPMQRTFAIAAFCALALFNIPFPIVLVGAAIAGAMLFRGGSHEPAPAPVETQSTSRMIVGTLGTILLWGLVWAAPLAVLFATLGPDHRLSQIGSFFSQLAIVTFGGAYAVLAYMAQAAVSDFGWVSATTMADGLGLAETTPGPLVMVTQFVGFMAAVQAPAPLTPLIAGVVASAIVTWVTFAPSFLMIFALAPWMDRLERVRWLHHAMTGITAAVVGVIANLALYFVLHLLFTTVAQARFGPLEFSQPALASFQPVAAALTVLALLLTFWRKMGTLPMLGLMACAGLFAKLVIGSA